MEKEARRYDISSVQGRENQFTVGRRVMQKLAMRLEGTRRKHVQKLEQAHF